MKRDSGLFARALLVAGVVLVSIPSFASDQPAGHTSAAVTSVASSPLADPSAAAQNQPDAPAPQQPDAQAQQPAPCHWWQFRRCNSNQPQAADIDSILPPEAPRVGPVIGIDVSTRTAYLFDDGQLVAKSAAAVGSGKVLVHGDDEWLFHTPQGHMKVKAKIRNPIWHKPDWAFIEAHKPVPPPNSPLREEKGVMGKYALSLGEGYYIHGTDDPASIGKAVSHGCVRLPDDMIKLVYNTAKVGTDVYIFESQPPQQASSGQPEHHSDLDYLKNR